MFKEKAAKAVGMASSNVALAFDLEELAGLLADG